MSVTVTYTGRDRYGIPREGTRTVLDPSVLVESLYAELWQDLTVIDATGAVVGGITKASDGRRHRWGEVVRATP